MKTKILGLITARGGSKSIPKKNIKFLCGKLLIAYTIDEAKKSGVFDRIILSTDDKEIADVGRKFGVEVPFMRPKKLAKDKTPTLPVLIHAISWLRENENYFPDYIMLLQPTSPFRNSDHIREAKELIEKSGADSVVGVGKIPEAYNPARAMIADNKGYIKLFNGKPVMKRITRRQDLPTVYYSNTSIYLFKTKLLLEKEPSLYGRKVQPYVMEEKYCLDINDPDDWAKAEDLMKKFNYG